jgi:hypothetical protein
MEKIGYDRNFVNSTVMSIKCWTSVLHSEWVEFQKLIGIRHSVADPVVFYPLDPDAAWFFFSIPDPAHFFWWIVLYGSRTWRRHMNRIVPDSASNVPCWAAGLPLFLNKQHFFSCGSHRHKRII